MGDVKRIEREIEELSQTEFSELRDWIIERDSRAWDSQIEQDARAGKLDELISKAEDDYRSGRAQEL